MALETRTPIQIFDGQGGVLTVHTTVDTQHTEPDPDGDPSPLVVSVEVTNSTDRPAHAAWGLTNRPQQARPITPGEAAGERIPPQARLPLYRYRVAACLGPA